MQLTWHRYKYYPYEKDLAIREIESLLSPAAIRLESGVVSIEQPREAQLANRLVYFSGFTDRVDATTVNETQQCLLERINGNGANRQSTRYSAHGLHEYKGKFNPQVAKAILNIFSARPGQIALDPFCGSGTSLVECAHLGIQSVGTDINPLAVFIANAKLHSLGIPAEQIRADAEISVAQAKRSRRTMNLDDERGEYLRSWFPPDYLLDIERLKYAICSHSSKSAVVQLAIASNLLRDYSLQEPHDLRIRRRKSPFPDQPFFEAFEEAAETFCRRLLDAQKTLGVVETGSRAINVDCKSALSHSQIDTGMFDLALTSPPYATALPYIDTQRLSLVWLDLLRPSEILTLEAELVGSREIRGQSKKQLLAALELNDAQLPTAEVEMCVRLQSALGDADGFRRQVVPRLLYRYFSAMSDAFMSIRQVVKPNAPFGLIVGGNHTVLSGTRFDISTPDHLASLAAARGWRHVETIPLQTYQRYGLHMNNATNTEALVILRAN